MPEKSQNDKENDKFSQINKENIVNWKKAEKLFEEHLNNIEIPFFRIDQEQDTKSKILKEKGIRRPDYIIQTKNDYFYVDVKFRTNIYHEENNKKRFTLDLDCFFALKGFSKNFNKEIWLAFTKDLTIPDFYYITLSQVNEYYDNLKNGLGHFFFDDIKQCDCQREIYKELFLFIPENLFFNRLSFEKGFYKDDKDYFINEALFHRQKWKDTLEYYNING